MKIWLIEDNRLLREAMRKRIESNGMHFVVAESETGKEAFRLAPKLDYDIALLDLSLPDVGGLACIRELGLIRLELPILVLNVYHEAQVAVQCLMAGAAGYLVKTASAEEKLEAIAEVGSGGVYLHPAVSSAVLETLRLGQSEGDPLGKDEILLLEDIAKGRSNQQLAEILRVSIGTVKNRIRGLFRFFTVSSRSDLVEAGKEAGYLLRDQESD